jgi:exocyst complex component 4
MDLIHSLCSMLQTTPFHRENYSRLIVGVIVQYYQQCSSRFKGRSTQCRQNGVTNGYTELASLPPAGAGQDQPLSLPAVWAQREDVIKLMTDLRSVAVGSTNPLSKGSA